MISRFENLKIVARVVSHTTKLSKQFLIKTTFHMKKMRFLQCRLYLIMYDVTNYSVLLRAKIQVYNEDISLHQPRT